MPTRQFRTIEEAGLELGLEANWEPIKLVPNAGRDMGELWYPQDDPRRCIQNGLETVELKPAGTVEDAVTIVGRRPSTRRLSPRSGSPHRQWDDAGEARQPHFGCLPIPAPATADHPSIPHHGRCSCSGTRTHTHAYRLLQRAPRFLSALSD